MLVLIVFKIIFKYVFTYYLLVELRAWGLSYLFETLEQEKKTKRKWKNLIANGVRNKTADYRVQTVNTMKSKESL